MERQTRSEKIYKEKNSNQKMKKVMIAALLLLTLVLLPMVSAETEISVKTLRYHQVNIFVLESGEVYRLLDEFHVEADKYGRANVKTKVSEDVVDILVNIKWNGNKVASERFEDLSTGEKIEIVLPESAKEIPDAEPETTPNEEGGTETPADNGNQESTGNTNPEEETTKEENPKQEPTTTGKTVLNGENDQGTSKKFWFIGIGLVVVVVVLFLMKGVFGPAPEFDPKNIGKSSEDTAQKMTNSEIEKAERRIKEAQAEINKIKNQGKIREAQKKIEEDRQKLERLKKGEDDEE